MVSNDQINPRASFPCRPRTPGSSTDQLFDFDLILDCSSLHSVSVDVSKSLVLLISCVYIAVLIDNVVQFRRILPSRTISLPQKHPDSNNAEDLNDNAKQHHTNSQRVSGSLWCDEEEWPSEVAETVHHDQGCIRDGQRCSLLRQTCLTCKSQYTRN